MAHRYQFDDNFLIITDEGTPGALGDSCAETARYAILKGHPVGVWSDFRTNIGYLRHPDSIWREDDTSSDQLVPYLIVLDLQNEKDLLQEARSRLKWTNANKHIASVGLMLLSRNWLTTLSIVNLIQGFIFKVPFRWNDGSRSIERTEKTSADYLNWFIIAVYLKRKKVPFSGLAKKVVTKEKLLERVNNYYSNPDAAWIVQAYEAAIPEVY